MTQVIGCLDKPALYAWYGKHGNEECNRIKKQSAEFGTTVHSLMDNHVMKKQDVVTYPEWATQADKDKMLECGQNLAKWYDDNGMEVISAEPTRAAVSKRYNFQGTWDWFGRKRGYEFILPADWKTSNRLYDTVGIQLSAYTQLFGEQEGWPDEEIFKRIPDGLGVRVDKETAKVYDKMFTGLQFYFEVFKHLLHVYEFHTGTGAWEK